MPPEEIKKEEEIITTRPADFVPFVSRVEPETEKIFVDGRKFLMTDEKKKRLAEGRDRYFKKQRELKALLPKVESLQESVFAISKDQPKEIELPMKGNVNPTFAREHVIKKIWNKKDKIIDAKIDQATGLYYVTPDGKHVYQNKPDSAASEYLLNQLIGKPTESMEVKQIIKIQVDI